MRLRKFFSLFRLIILSSILLMAASCKEGVVDPVFNVLTTENLLKLQSAADLVITKYNTPGLAAYISVEGEGELVITRGVSNLVTSEPMNENNYFRIGSVTKTFTTEAVLILSDQKLIDLNKSISYYFPELNIPDGEKITIRMLGNMTSGLFNYTEDPEFLNPLYNSDGTKVYTTEEIIAVALNRPLNFTPGTKYEYCNTNTVILGLLIEKVTGKSVGEVFNEKIFIPLGMSQTFWPNFTYLPYPYSHGYFYGVDVANWSPSHSNAAGILISSLADLKKWMKEINERNLLSAEAKTERFGWVDQDGTGMKFYGFGLSKSRGWIGHSGGIVGYNTMFFYHPEKKITIILYTNCNDGAPASAAFSDFAKILGAW